MAGNLYRRGKTWWGRIQVANRDLRKSLRTDSRPQAAKRLAEWKADIEHARFYGHSRMTWQDAVGRYCEEVIPGAIEASTAKRYIVSFRQVAPHLDGHYVDAIGRREIAALVSARKRGRVAGGSRCAG